MNKQFIRMNYAVIVPINRLKLWEKR